jgi:hypothetical protein
MSLKRSALFVVLLAVVCISQRVFAQKTTPANAAPVYVPMPADIQCYIVSGGDRFEAGTPRTPPGQNDDSVVLLAVQEVGCHIAGKGNSDNKKIPLASTQVTDRMLRTRDFGELKLGDDPDGVAWGNNIKIAIRRDKLQSFRDFLQK